MKILSFLKILDLHILQMAGIVRKSSKFLLLYCSNSKFLLLEIFRLFGTCHLMTADLTSKLALSLAFKKNQHFSLYFVNRIVLESINPLI